MEVRSAPSNPRSRVLAPPNQAEIWLSGDGDDRSSGFENAPVKTSEEVGRRLGDGIIPPDLSVVVRIKGRSANPNGYNLTPFCTPRFIAGCLTWRNEGLFTPASGTLTFTSRSGATYTFAGQAWTRNQWAGYSLEALSSQTGVTPGLKRFVIANTADTVTLGYPHFNPQETAGPAANDTFRLTSSACEFELSPDLGNGSFIDPCVTGGPATMNISNYAERSRGWLRLEGLALRVPQGVPFFNVHLTGAIVCNGVEVTTPPIGWAPQLLFRKADVMLGEWFSVPGFPNRPLNTSWGWGLACRERELVVNPNNGICAFSFDASYAEGNITNAQFSASGGCWINLGGSSFHGAVGWTAALEVETGSRVNQYNLNSATYPFHFIQDAATRRDIMVRGAGELVFGRIVHDGIGAVFLALQNGMMTKSGGGAVILAPGASTPLIASGNQSRAAYNGQVYFTGGDPGATLGDVSAGTVLGYTNRAAAAWAAGTRIAAPAAQPAGLIQRLN